LAVSWSEVQYRRLQELRAEPSALEQEFSDANIRDKTFQQLEKKLVQQERQLLQDVQEQQCRSGLLQLERGLADTLVEKGFVQVQTPIMLSKGLLQKMGITEGHPLNEQVYWLGKNQCLRPMLAPNLYYILKDLLRLWLHPVRIFEIGPCFRKESQGAKHSSEFTMLNIVEMGLPEHARQERIKELSILIMQAAGIESYSFEQEGSEVYGQTMDIISSEEGIELGSSAMGPHPLDQAWRIQVPWIGIGFGLERLAMVAAGGSNLNRYGRSLTYLNGIRLNI
jgi:phenylalanyl-tRNA synthetase alpha chain